MRKNWAYVVEESGHARTIALDEVVDAHRVAPFIWVHLDGRDADNLTWLTTECGLPKTALAALTATETRPRGDALDGGAIINLRGLGATPDDDPDRLVSVRLWADAGRVISISFRSLAGIHGVREAVQAGRVLDPGDLIVALADSITARLDPEVATLGDVVDDLETNIGNSGMFGARHKVTDVRSAAIDYRRFLQPQRNALERLSMADLPWLTDEDRLHLREAADRAARMAEEMEAIRERSALLHEQLTDLRTEQIDQRSLIVAIIALIFLPLTFVSGLFGMNVPGIPFREDPFAFWWIAGASTVFGLVLWGLVRWRRWI